MTENNNIIVYPSSPNSFSITLSISGVPIVSYSVSVCPRCGRETTSYVHLVNTDFCGFEFICTICYNSITGDGKIIPVP